MGINFNTRERGIILTMSWVTPNSAGIIFNTRDVQMCPYGSVLKSLRVLFLIPVLFGGVLSLYLLYSVAGIIFNTRECE